MMRGCQSLDLVLVRDEDQVVIMLSALFIPEKHSVNSESARSLTPQLRCKNTLLWRMDCLSSPTKKAE